MPIRNELYLTNGTGAIDISNHQAIKTSETLQEGPMLQLFNKINRWINEKINEINNLYNLNVDFPITKLTCTDISRIQAILNYLNNLQNEGIVVSSHDRKTIINEYINMISTSNFHHNLPIDEMMGELKRRVHILIDDLLYRDFWPDYLSIYTRENYSKILIEQEKEQACKILLEIVAPDLQNGDGSVLINTNKSSELTSNDLKKIYTILDYIKNNEDIVKIITDKIYRFEILIRKNAGYYIATEQIDQMYQCIQKLLQSKQNNQKSFNSSTGTSIESPNDHQEDIFSSDSSQLPILFGGTYSKSRAFRLSLRPENYPVTKRSRGEINSNDTSTHQPSEFGNGLQPENYEDISEATEPDTDEGKKKKVLVKERHRIVLVEDEMKDMQDMQGASTESPKKVKPRQISKENLTRRPGKKVNVYVTRSKPGEEPEI